MSDAGRPFTPQEENCMLELNSAYEDHLSQVDNPVPQTCKWILKHKQFQWWASSRSSALLWISANPGCGKSVMAKFLITHLQSVIRSKQSTNISYFFFKEGLEEQDNASSMVSALLHQLYTRQRPLVRHALAKFLNTQRRIFNRFSSLWAIFIDSIQDPMANETICVIDGLDECEGKSLAQLTQGITNLFNTKSANNFKFKLLLLSRPNNRMETSLCLYGNEDINYKLDAVESGNRRRLLGENESDHLQGDIAKFAKHKVDQLSQTSALPIDVLKRLDNQLLAGADFTFLWISLVMQLIEDSQINGISIAKLELILNTNKLDDLYESLLDGRTLPLKTRKVLYIVLAAVRPLTLKEMCVAIEVHQDHHPRDKLGEEVLAKVKESGLEPYQTSEPQANGQAGKDSQLRNKSVQNNAVGTLQDLRQHLHTPFANHLRQICGHLVRIRNRKIYLVHQTARDFLLKELPGSIVTSLPLKTTIRWNLLESSESKWRHSIVMEDANRYLLQVCANYLSLFTSQPAAGRKWNRQKVRKYLRECERDRPRAFFHYAAKHWTKHYRPVRNQQSHGPVFDYLLDPSMPYLKAWIFVHSSFVLGKEELETGPGTSAMWIDGEKRPTDAEHARGRSSGRYSRHSSPERPNLRKVLDHFFPMELDMELFDSEFIAGDHYWKKNMEGSVSNDSSDDEEDEEEDQGDRIPDRILFYRRQHHKKLTETYKNLSNPLSPGSENPTVRLFDPESFQL